MTLAQTKTLQTCCKLSILQACCMLSFADLLQLVETTCIKPLDNKFGQSVADETGPFLNTEDSEKAISDDL